MIKESKNIKILKEPFMGTEMFSLFTAFRKQPARMNLYETEQGSLLLNFDLRLVVSGKVDTEELLSFTKFLDIRKIEGLKDDFDALNMPFSSHRIFKFEGECPDSFNIERNSEMRIPFNIISQSDESFCENTDYYYWLSDVRCMEKAGVYDIFTLDNKATCSVSSKGMGYALLSEIATLPEERGKGLASNLIKGVCHKVMSEGLVPYLISKDEKTDSFYKKLGFKEITEKIIINI